MKVPLKLITVNAAELNAGIIQKKNTRTHMHMDTPMITIIIRKQDMSMLIFVDI